MSYLRKSLFGLSWTMALSGVTSAASLLRTIILARILFPSQIGSFGIAAMALGLLEILTETGINVVLLQHEGNYHEILDSAWVVSIIRGVVIAILIALATPFIANFFSAPDSIILLYLIALVPLVRGFINPACIKFIKELHFEREFAYRTGLTIVEIGTSVIFALITRSATSFVWGLLASATAEVVLSFVIFSPRPIFHYQWGQIKRILHSGKWVTGFGVFDYVFTQGDNVTVGRLLGEAPLGIYRVAYSFSTYPVTQISEGYYTVMFPVFVQMRHDLAGLKKAVLKSTAVASLVMTLAGLFVFWLADPGVHLLLGAKWLTAIPVIRILAFAGIFRGLSYVFNSLFVALGKQKYITYIIFVSMAVLLITIIPGVKLYGMVGAGYAVALSSICALPLTIFLATKLLRQL